MGGASRPWGRSLTAEEARHPRALCNCLAYPGAWPIQTTGSPLYPRSYKPNRGAVKEDECDRACVFSNTNGEVQPLVGIHRVIVACGSSLSFFLTISKTRQLLSHGALSSTDSSEPEWE